MFSVLMECSYLFLSYAAHASMLHKNSLPNTVMKVCTTFSSKRLTVLALTLKSLLCFELIFEDAIWSNLIFFPCVYPIFPALFSEKIILSPCNGVDTLWKSVGNRCMSSLSVPVLLILVCSIMSGLAWPCFVVKLSK